MVWDMHVLMYALLMLGKHHHQGRPGWRRLYLVDIERAADSNPHYYICLRL